MTDSDPRGLGTRQKLHVVLTAKLIAYIASQGLEMTWGETYRAPAQALNNARLGIGIANSLHGLRLAVDLQLFKAGVYLNGDSTGAYTLAGTYWKTLDPLACWGGDFAMRDYDHFSITWQGVK